MGRCVHLEKMGTVQFLLESQRDCFHFSRSRCCVFCLVFFVIVSVFVRLLAARF